MEIDNNNNLSEYIGGIIKSSRKDKELTQTELADIVGTKQPSIARLESGECLPSLVFLKKVSNSLGIEIGIVMKDKVPSNMRVRCYGKAQLVSNQ